jgi:heme-degrading monooxygenase HmoA
MYVSINHIPVVKERAEDFENLFRQREGAVDKQPGFLSLDVLRPAPKMAMGKPFEENAEEPNDYQVVTRWVSEEAFKNWIRSDAFKQSHSRGSDPTIFAGRSYQTTHQVVDGASASVSS